MSLCSYSGKPIVVAGEVTVTISYVQAAAGQGITSDCQGDGPSLSGRNWLEHFNCLDWQEILANIVTGVPAGMPSGSVSGWLSDTAGSQSEDCH